MFCEKDKFWDVKSCELRGEGRRNWVVGLMYGVRMNQMITLESIEFFFFMNVRPVFIFFTSTL